MKIVYYCAQLYKLGGVERVTTLKVNYLASQGHEVSVICKDQGDAPPFYPLDERVKLYDLGHPEVKDQGLIAKVLNKHKRYGKLKARLSALLSELKPDVAVSTLADHYPIFADIEGRFLSVLEYHGGGVNTGSTLEQIAVRMREGRLYRFLAWYGLRREVGWRECNPLYYDKCVLLAQEFVQRFESYGYDNISRIPNPSPLVDPSPSDGLAKNVLALGRFVPEKHFEELVEIWALVHPSHPDWRLTIVGDGDDKPSVLERIRALGLEGSVDIRETTKDVVPYFQGASIYALTSRNEGFPMALVESMSMGVPICAYDCPGGVRDVFVDGEEGFLIPYGDRQAFADRLSQLMSDEALRLRMGQTAKAGSERYTVPAVMEQWYKLFGWSTPEKG